MSVFTDSFADYLESDLGSEAPTVAEWKLLTAWVYISTGTSLGSQNVISSLMAYDSGNASTTQDVPQCLLRFDGSRNFQVMGRVNQSGSNTIVNSGYTIPLDTWTLCAALCPPDDGTNRLFHAFANDPTVNTGNANATSSGSTTIPWNRVRIGNEQPLSNFRDANANVAEVSVFVVSGANDAAVLTNAQALLSDMWNGGTPKAANNLTSETPNWYAKLTSDASVAIGSSITTVGAPAFNGSLNPTLQEAAPVNPVHTAGPNTSSAETSVTVTGTSDEDCTAQFLITTQAAAQPSDAAFDASSDTVAVTATIQYTVPITGLAAQTAYRVWVRLKPSLGNSSVASSNFSTTAAAPTISTVNSGQPINEGSVFRVTGTNVGLHSAADINGQTQSNYTVVDNDNVDITCVLPVGLRFDEAATLSISGATATVTITNQVGWQDIQIIDLWPTKAERIDAGQSWALANNDYVDWEVTADNVVVDNTGRATADAITAFDAKIFDSSDNTWGAEGTYTAEAATPSADGSISAIAGITFAASQSFGQNSGLSAIANISFQASHSLSSNCSISAIGDISIVASASQQTGVSASISAVADIDFVATGAAFPTLNLSILKIEPNTNIF